MRCQLRRVEVIDQNRLRRACACAWVVLFLTAGLTPGWACTIFTDRFDNLPSDDRFIECFGVTTLTGPNGMISPESVNLVPDGEALSFLLIPEEAYKVDQVTGCDGTLENDTTYVTSPIIASCQINASFTNVGDCSLWDQNCPKSQGCYVGSGDGTTICSTSGGAGLGESCSFVNECEPGLICAGQPSSNCRPLCNTNGSVTCESGDCFPVGISNIGACF
jgi:hypothetical protein